MTKSDLRSSEPVLDTLSLVTSVYLGLPLLLFIISWFQWHFALGFGGLLVGIYFCFHYNLKEFKVKKFGKYLLVFIVFLILLGFGEIMPLSGDWGKHNAIFSQLYSNWNQPVYIHYAGAKHILCYGLGFYMLPAWIAGLFQSIVILKGLILINSAVGMALIGLWLNRLWNFPIWAVLLIFLMNSFEWIMDIGYFQSIFSDTSRIISAISANQFLSRIDQTPHQGISTFLVFLSIWKWIRHTRPSYLFCLFTSALGFFWNPFLLFALSPLLVFVKFKSIFRAMKSREVCGYFAVGILLAILIYYYSAHLKVDRISIRYATLKQLFFTLPLRYLIIYGVFLAWIYYLNLKVNYLFKNDIKLIGIFLIISLVFKHIGYGFYNDFSSKTTFLILFILNLYFIKLILVSFNSLNKVAKIGIMSFIGISSMMSILLFVFKIITLGSYTKAESIGFTSRKYLLSSGKSITLNEVLAPVSNGNAYPFIIQYLGTTSKYSKQLLKDLNK